MNRCALALAGLLALPVHAAAQNEGVHTTEPHPQQLPYSRFAVTPFAGVRLPFTTGDFHVFTEDGREYIVQQEREGSYLVGVNAEARLTRALGLIGGVAYSGAAQDVSVFQPALDGDEDFQIDGPTFWFAKAGVSWRLPDPARDSRRFHPSALITVAPAVVVTRYADVEGFPSLSRTKTQFAINVGADAMTRLGRGNWALTLGMEDYMTFWNEDDLVEREATVWNFVAEDEIAGVDFDYSTSHILMVRLGVSYRP